MTGTGDTIIPSHIGPIPDIPALHQGDLKARMRALAHRVYERWLSFQFDRQCRRLARRHLANSDDLFQCLMQRDEVRADSDALKWTTGLLASAMPHLEVDLLSRPALRKHLIEAYRRLPTRQRRLLLIYLARERPFETFAARCGLGRAQALRELCAAIRHFQSELETVEARPPQNRPS